MLKILGIARLHPEILAQNSADLPHRWIAGDDEMGRPYWFRRRLASLGKRYLLAVPSNTAMRDLEVEPPVYSGRGRRPGRPWHTMATWSQSLDDAAWQRLDVRDGSKGPLVVEAVKTDRPVLGCDLFRHGLDRLRVLSLP